MSILASKVQYWSGSTFQRSLGNCSHTGFLQWDLMNMQNTGARDAPPMPPVLLNWAEIGFSGISASQMNSLTYIQLQGRNIRTTCFQLQHVDVHTDIVHDDLLCDLKVSV